MTKCASRLLAALLVAGIIVPAWAQELKISAKVDKTTVNIGEPVTLIITLSGDLSGLTMAPPQLPDGLAVAARSQSTDFAIHAGMMERSTSLIYVLIPQQAGVFHLGPFKAVRDRAEFQTAPIEITAKKPTLPPSLKPPQGGRVTI
ncbi:MAG: BatD family protein [Candidatus Omnitrophica bacterium]|nr:BatD family protein [Candidatus Omnitrophota bacterium]